MSSLKLPEPIKVSKQITNQLDELEKKGESIVSFCGYANIETLFYLHLIKKYDKIRIASIWNLDNLYNINLYKNIAWYFAGGIFGGDINSLNQFANLMKEKCIEIITTKNTIMWEVNIWYLIYNENKELFDSYYGNHDNTIIDNY